MVIPDSDPRIETAIKGRPGVKAPRPTVETDPTATVASVVRAVQQAAPVGHVRRAGTAIAASAPTVGSVRSADKASSVGVGGVRRKQAVTAGTIRPEPATSSVAAVSGHRRGAATVGSALSADRAISVVVTSAPPEPTAIVMSGRPVGVGNPSASRVSAPVTGVRIRRLTGPRRCGGAKQIVRASTAVPADAG